MYHEDSQRTSFDDESRKSLLEKDDIYHRAFLKYHLWQRSIFPVTFILLLLSNIVLLHKFLQSRNLDRICSSYTEQHRSPVLDALDITYNTVQFNGSFSKETIYRKLAGTGYEVDEAWIALGVDLHPVSIPVEQGERYGLHNGQVKLDKKLGGGFVAYVEAMHHMHCLNLLRQTSYWNYPYYKRQGLGPFKNDEPVVIQHAGHCLDILRQQLMCTADTSVFGQWWVKDVGAWVDFNTKHKCKNFEDIRKWVEDHQTNPNDMVRSQPGDVILPELP